MSKVTAVHEFGYCEDILAAVERRASGRAVTAVRIRAGVAHRLVQDSLQLAFDTLAVGTVAEGATIQCIQQPYDLECRSCDTRAEVHDPLPHCPACGGVDISLSGGNDVILEAIQLRPAGAGVDDGA